MNKKILFIILTLSAQAFAGVEDPKWLSITRDIARDGSPNDKGEFQFAIEAMKRIEKPRMAGQAASAIHENWGKKSTDDKILAEARLSELNKITRYPDLKTPKDIKNAADILLTKPDIKTFLDQVGVEVVEAGSGGTPLTIK